jgi:hypothetical protein
MSRYEWERGEFKLPAAEYRNLKKRIVNAANQYAEKVFEKTLELYEALSPKGRRQREDWTKLSDVIDEYLRVSEPKDPAKQSRIAAIRHELLAIDGWDAALRAIGTSPRKPTKKHLSLFATTKTNEFRTDYAFLTFSDNNMVYWSVPENNHAVDHARKSWLGRAFFIGLDKVEWTGKTGGEIIGGDEYSRHDDYDDDDDYDDYDDDGDVVARYGRGY